MEPRINPGQPAWLGAWLQDHCHQVLAATRQCFTGLPDSCLSHSAAVGRVQALTASGGRRPTTDGGLAENPP
jgi:hypothetical protein